jgi:hypothetical protein
MFKPIIDTLTLTGSGENGLEDYESEVARVEGGNNILVIITGMNGSVHGYEDKYFKIAEKVNTEFNSTVFIFANDEKNWSAPKNSFGKMMTYVKNHVDNEPETDISVFGFSAGASFTSYYAYQYPEIRQILLVNPPLQVNMARTINGVQQFKGNSTLVVGENDINCKRAHIFTTNKYKSVFTKVEYIKGANHYFSRMLDVFISLPFKYLYSGKIGTLNEKI